MKAIYLTHCSREKDERLRSSDEKVTPDRLYTSPGLLAFIDHCRKDNRNWAIFSDNYGVVFPEEKISWYDKPPDTVTSEEFEMLLENFIDRLSGFDEIYFYHRLGETHPLFQKIQAMAIEQGMPVREFTEDKMDRKP